MMVKNQTDHTVFVGGSAVPPDGDFHQVQDTDGTREAIAAGVLTKQRGGRSSGQSGAESGAAESGTATTGEGGDTGESGDGDGAGDDNDNNGGDS